MQPILSPVPEATPQTRANRANALHSTGPRTESGKLRSFGNAITHGLTSRAPVLRSEDAAAYEQHCREFQDEYQPATPTEKHLVQELAGLAWRLNRIPHLEVELLRDARFRDPYHALATLSMHGQRLSRQFQKTLEQLRSIQSEHGQRQSERRQRAAAKTPQTKSVPSVPAGPPTENGFVFSAAEVEALRIPEEHRQPLECEQHASAAAAGASK